MDEINEQIKNPIDGMLVQLREVSRKTDELFILKRQNELDEKLKKITKDIETKQFEKQPYITNHHSELLDIMHTAIAEFWENHDPNNPPKNDVIELWISEKYAELINKRVLSKHIIKSMCTIMRPQIYK